MAAVARSQRPCIIQVDVVFWKEKSEFFGHCLQFDIVSVGQTPVEAEDQIRKLILAHIKYVNETDNWDYLYRPAPAEVWQRFAQAARRSELPHWIPRPPRTAIEWMAQNTRISTRFSFV